VKEQHFTNPRSRKKREHGEAKLAREAKQAERRAKRLCTVGGCMFPLAHEGKHDWAAT
jgi:hypothetical protein